MSANRTLFVKRAALPALVILGVLAAFQNCTGYEALRSGESSSLSSPSLDPTPVPTPVPTPAPAPTVGPKLGTTELITDPMMQTGFRTQDGCPNLTDNVGSGACAVFKEHVVKNPMYPAFAAAAPKWLIQQWGSRSNLPVGAPAAYGDGLIWKNADKSFAVFPGGIFEMGINGFNDFGGVYRQKQPGRPAWPSFTLSFNTADANAPNTALSGTVDQMKALVYSMDVRLANEDRHQNTGYDPNQNSVIFVGYMSVQNLNSKSAGYGQYVWMGIPIYNDLEQMPARYVNGDSYGDGLGTGMLIYSPGFAVYSQTSVWSLQWVHLQADMLPHVKAALAEGVKKGMLKDPNLANYYVSGLNTGYEVTGLNETALQFKNISLKVTR